MGSQFGLAGSAGARFVRGGGEMRPIKNADEAKFAHLFLQQVHLVGEGNNPFTRADFMTLLRKAEGGAIATYLFTKGIVAGTHPVHVVENYTKKKMMSADDQRLVYDKYARAQPPRETKRPGLRSVRAGPARMPSRR